MCLLVSGHGDPDVLDLDVEPGKLVEVVVDGICQIDQHVAAPINGQGHPHPVGPLDEPYTYAAIHGTATLRAEGAGELRDVLAVK